MSDHKRKYDQFCDPQYSRDAIDFADASFYRKKTEALRADFVNSLPDAPPADGFMYAVWMTKFHQLLKQANDAFVMARLAYIEKRGEAEADADK